MPHTEEAPTPPPPQPVSNMEELAVGATVEWAVMYGGCTRGVRWLYGIGALRGVAQRGLAFIGQMNVRLAGGHTEPQSHAKSPSLSYLLLTGRLPRASVWTCRAQ